MVKRHSLVVEGPASKGLGTEWFLEAVFPNGKAVVIRGLATDDASECPGSFRYLKSTGDNPGDISAQTAIPASTLLNARASGSAPVSALLAARTREVSSYEDRTDLDGQTFAGSFERSIASASGLTSPAPKSLGRLREKWMAVTLSPWFPLMCAGVSFATLLVFTGILAGLAFTKQPVRVDTITWPGIGASTQHEQAQPTERNYANDPIAILIERTLPRQ